jgi:hypothetical protein
MKKGQTDPDMLPEYDFRGGVRGKYFGKLTRDSKVCIIGAPSSAKERKSQPTRVARNGKKRKRA